MRVTISSSASELISDEYKNSARKLANFLASEGCSLNWGSGSSSIMGICYQEFSKLNCDIFGYTTPKYVSIIDDLPKAKHTIYDNTFLLKKNLFYDADLIICLPGGLGTISEFFSYLEEIRSNDINKTLIIYNENNHFDKVIELIDDLIERYFSDKSIKNYYKVVNSFEEFIKIYSELEK